MKLKIFVVLSVFSFVCLDLHGEIQKAIANWNPLLCRESCVPLLTRNLQAMPGVAAVQISAPAGVAEMTWNPRVPFNLSSFNTAFRSTGIRLKDIRVRVKGNVTTDGTNFFIVSTGDNSRFQLIGPTLPSPTEYVTRDNIATHPLPELTKIELANAAAARKTVTVEGRIFEPNRYNLILITEQINVSGN